MKVEVRNVCSDFESYRAARVKSLFNVESGANFSLDAELPLEGREWQIGVIVGPSGSGKTSIGRQLFGGGALYEPEGWPGDAPIVDAIAPGSDLDHVTGALAAVGLGSVPSWLRPYHALSNGERFRADLARIVAEAPEAIVVDEFTSVVDRQIAKIGALAFAKSWRRTKGQVVLLSCHYDVLDWIQPDWVYDTGKTSFVGRWERPRPRFDVDIRQTDWSYWPLFEPHHYLKLPRMVGAFCYVGSVDGEPVAHLAVSTRPGMREARACRMVVMPEWQGAGAGMRFLNAICEHWLRGENPHRRRMRSLFHTSHPGLCAALRRDKRWRQISSSQHGGSKLASSRTLRASANRRGRTTSGEATNGYGGHLRAVQGFRYYGQAGVDAWEAKRRKR